MGKSIRTMDGGALVVAENGLDSTMGSGRLVLIKLDSQGVVTWSRSYADGFGWSFNSAQLAKPLQTSDGGYLVPADLLWASGSVISNEIVVVKVDSQGNPVWEKRVSPADCTPSAILQAPDGGYFLMGNTSAFGSPGTNAWLLKFDSLFNFSWAKAYSGINGNQVVNNNDGTFVLGGRSAVMEINTTGDIIWSARYQKANNDTQSSALAKNSSGYVVGGLVSGTGAGYYDAYLIQLDPNGKCSFLPGSGWTETDNVVASVNTSATIETASSFSSTTGGVAASINSSYVANGSTATETPF